MDLNSLKLFRKEEIKTMCQNDIYAVYSKEDQLNALRKAAIDPDSLSDLKSMNDFIDLNISICNERKKIIDSCSSVEELMSLDFD